MKRLRKIMFVLLVFVMAAGLSLTAQAAKNKLKNKGGTFGKYYYYKSGKMQKKTWRNFKQKGVKYRFYFGKNGVAYRAKKPFDGRYNVKVYKIKGKQYGFDTMSHLVAGGTYADTTGKIWVFQENGQLDSTATNALRSTFPQQLEGTDLYDKVISQFGEPLSVDKDDSCNGWNTTDSFKDYMINYKYFQVQLVCNESANPKVYKLTRFVSQENW